jgi:CubicO group peptidase (beta-lactamase class C family)
VLVARRHVVPSILAAIVAFQSIPAQRQPLPSKAVAAARIDSLIDAYMALGGATSLSLAVVRGTDTLVTRSWGMADVAAKRPSTPMTTYRIGSVSKQFTAALILKLVDRGTLALSDSIGRYLSGLRPEWRPLTIEQLLNHTSGLQNDFRSPLTYTMPLPVDSLIAMAARDTMVFAPGTKHAYSNTGYMLLGALVEKQYAKSFAAALRDEIARPLGLATLGWCDVPEVTRTQATGYDPSTTGTFTPATYLHISQSLGSGGICSSAMDLAKWNSALHRGRVVSPASYAAMSTPRGAAVAGAYGFGLRLQRTGWGAPLLSHSGSTPGFVANNAYFSADSLSVVILVNNSSLDARAANLVPFLARISLGLPLPTPPPARPSDTRP